MIYALVSSKGGVGKTTDGVHLATYLAGKGQVLLVDADPQASAATWAAWRRESEIDAPSPTTTRLLGRSVLDEGKNLSKGFDNTVIDVGGRDSASLRAALLLANKAIIPVGASGLDAAAMSDVIEVIEMSKDFNPDLKVCVLLSRLDTRTKDVGEMLEFLSEQGLPILEARICERVAFRRAITAGSVVHENSKDRKAIAEMQAFFEEVTA